MGIKKISALRPKSVEEVLALGPPAEIPIGVYNVGTFKISLQELLLDYGSSTNTYSVNYSAQNAKSITVINLDTNTILSNGARVEQGTNVRVTVIAGDYTDGTISWITNGVSDTDLILEREYVVEENLTISIVFTKIIRTDFNLTITATNGSESINLFKIKKDSDSYISTNGTVVIPNLIPGVYTITIEANEYERETASIVITDSDVSYEFILQAIIDESNIHMTFKTTDDEGTPIFVGDIYADDILYLQWTTENATRATLFYDDVPIPGIRNLNEFVFPVQLKDERGSVEAVFKLVAENDEGDRNQKEITVDVYGTFPVEGSFILTPFFISTPREVVLRWNVLRETAWGYVSEITVDDVSVGTTGEKRKWVEEEEHFVLRAYIIDPVTGQKLRGTVRRISKVDYGLDFTDKFLVGEELDGSPKIVQPWISGTIGNRPEFLILFPINEDGSTRWTDYDQNGKRQVVGAASIDVASITGTIGNRPEFNILEPRNENGSVWWNDIDDNPISPNVGKRQIIGAASIDVHSIEGTIGDRPSFNIIEPINEDGSTIYTDFDTNNRRQYVGVSSIDVASIRGEIGDRPEFIILDPIEPSTIFKDVEKPHASIDVASIRGEIGDRPEFIVDSE